VSIDVDVGREGGGGGGFLKGYNGGKKKKKEKKHMPAWEGEEGFETP